MKTKQIVVLLQYDNLALQAVIFEPEKVQPKAIVQISHGMAEHKERYYDFMEFLAQQGYIAIIHDHRGHGKSVKNKEDLGYFYEGSSKAIVDDLHQISLEVKKEYPDLPLFLFGHSMGSMVVRKYIKTYDNEIQKLIVCGSPSKNSFTFLGLCLVKIMEIFKGEKYRSRLIHQLAFGSYNKNFSKNKSKNTWIAQDEKTVSDYNEDDLCGFVFTLNGFENLFRLMLEIYQKKGWKKQNLELPILFISGEQDPVMINAPKWLESQKFLSELGYQKVSGKLYANMRHEILNEKHREDVYKYLLQFFEQ